MRTTGNLCRKGLFPRSYGKGLAREVAKRKLRGKRSISGPRRCGRGESS